MRGPFGGAGWDYPPGSMVGSGINSYEYVEELGCFADVDGPDEYGDPAVQCSFVGEVEVHVNDYGTHFWECPECGTEHEFSG